jgi:hypothetical protein
VDTWYFAGLKNFVIFIYTTIFFSFPDSTKRSAIATKLGVTQKQVKTWFAERRKTAPELTRNTWPFPLVDMGFIGSSHAEHGFPEEMEKLRPHFSWCGPFGVNSFDSQGGRKIRDVEVEIIRNHFLFARG